MAEKACHVFTSTTQVGLIQALGRMEGIYVVTVEASPVPGTSEFSEFGGTYINVYTTSRTESEALTVAASEVKEAGWQFDAVDEVHWVTREDLSESPEGLEYFEQALLDGIVVVVHTYPPDLDE